MHQSTREACWECGGKLMPASRGEHSGQYVYEVAMVGGVPRKVHRFCLRSATWNPLQARPRVPVDGQRIEPAPGAE